MDDPQVSSYVNDYGDNGFAESQETPHNQYENAYDTQKIAFHGVRDSVRRIEELTSTVSHAIDALYTKEGSPLSSSIEHALVNISREEQSLFSNIYTHTPKKDRKGKTLANSSSRSIDRVNDIQVNGHTGQFCSFDNSVSRIVIDPNVPLRMPFNMQCTSEHFKKGKINGHYHDLFFGNPEAFVFSPPENNKRKELEKIQAEKLLWKKKFVRPPREQTVFALKTVKVSKDFIPSCAAVDHSAVREQLKKRPTSSVKYLKFS
ncbi:hypothetical protein ERJ75_000215400 [Trypanosoma vivax]|uniref:Uncharacterized protein n=1 Tax=Trypanosoma vivax (strain Y486) TaxID=1055687 RepID=G0U9U2_TRYVY|nr:hypothetical protein TRVL_10098 [Trypanosoma vivax]KAH8619080.1 hypothetical protein ERJ75_000215400 [Trypanosoma vivax]CCC52573.1 conserved hypothetical protein [Trypanosoma vivax Y486]